MVIVGGGPAAGAAARTAASRGARVVMIAERRDRRRSWAGESLPPGAEALVNSVFGEGLLQMPPHSRAYGVRGAWGSDELVDTDFIAHPRGDGWHLDRTVFDRDTERVAVEAGVEVIRDRGVGAVRIGSAWQLHTASGRRVSGQWLFDATGRTARIASSLGLTRQDHDDQVALVAVVPGQTEVAATTVIESEADGWWYCTPLPGDRRVVAFLTDRDMAPVARDRSLWWHAKLMGTTHIRGLAGDVRPDVSLRLTAANTTSRTSATAPGFLAVGDAAMAWDPLSSQGLVTGILMGARAGALVADSTSNTAARDVWARDYAMILDEHLALRRHYWSAEQRWPESLYWSRRR